jgi:hypothetical protein
LTVNTAASFATTLTTAAAVFDTKWHFITLTRTAAGLYSWFVDGVADNTATTTAFDIDSGFDLMVGAQQLASSPFQSNFLWGKYALLAGHNRAISLQEHQLLARNPWQLFAPRQIWIPASGSIFPVPTLSNPTAINITASSFQPRVSYAF